jgi:putative ABC transport system ATP-binding protein
MTLVDPDTESEASQDRRGPLLQAIDVVRDYPSGDTVIHALRNVSLAADPGELVAVRGRSGSGKTTFLNILGGLDQPTSGRVIIDGHEVSSMSEDELVDVRRRSVAFIFQSFGLVPILSAAENVEIPLRLVKAESRGRDARVRELLELVGLGDRAKHRPHELSGGEQQRVAIARAIVGRPRILLADEPTGNLDSQMGDDVMGILKTLNAEDRTTIVMVTHDQQKADQTGRIVRLFDGRQVN